MEKNSKGVIRESLFPKFRNFLASRKFLPLKYAWVVPLKDKKGIAITNGFKKILIGSNHRPNKICVNKGSEFYNRSMKSWLRDNDIEIYLPHNEGKPVVTERFIRTLKNKL